MSRLPHRWRTFRATDAARRALGAAMIAAVTLATLLGGRAYFYCRAMDRIMAQSACECAQSQPEDPGCVAIAQCNDCFELRVLGRLASFTPAHDTGVPAAAFVAMLPSFPSVSAPAGVVLAGATHPIRAGPFSPTAARAQLMVFLT